jgi:hypothetical protein
MRPMLIQNYRRAVQTDDVKVAREKFGNQKGEFARSAASLVLMRVYLRLCLLIGHTQYS